MIERISHLIGVNNVRIALLLCTVCSVGGFKVRHSL